VRRPSAVLLTVAFLAAATAGAFLVRAGRAPWAPYRISAGDSEYHHRLAEVMDRGSPRVPAFDPYLDHPTGAAVPWPLLQEAVAVAVTRALGGGADRLRAVCFLLPAVAGAACLPLVFALARGVGVGTAAACAAAVFGTLSIPHREYTAAGQFDHHAPDAALVLLFLLAAGASWRRRTRPGGAAAVIASSAAVGACAALLLANWLGSVGYLGLLAGACALCAVPAARRDPAYAPWLSRLAGSLAAGALVLAAAVGLAYGGARLAEVKLDRPGAFQPLALLAAALAIGLAGAAGSARRAPLVRRCLPWALPLLTVTALLLPEALRGAGLYLGGRDRLMRTITESVSPFLVGTALERRLSLSSGVAAVGWAGLLLPALAAWGWRRRGGWRDEPGAFPRVLLTVFSLAALAAALLQYRYGIFLAPFAGIWSGVLVDALIARLRDGSARGRAAALAGILLTAASFLPAAAEAARSWARPWHHDPALRVTDEAMAWLAAQTPPASDPLDLRQRPAYGTITRWGFGHTVIGLGRRPTMAAGFVGTLPGTLRTQPFFVEEDPDRALAFAQANRVRYLVLESAPDAVATALYALGQEERCRRLVGEGTAALYRSGEVPVVLRLWSSLGGAEEREGRIFPGTRHFRPLWDGVGEVPAGGGRARRILIFEAVPGARLAGAAPPGTRVWATLALDTRTEQGLPWVETAVAGAGGRWEMTLPIPTDHPSGAVAPRGPWEIRSGENAVVRRVALAESDVMAGRTIEVP
jgi:dolichyl-diphosphooligosaccharide--protein glycosyltransferase